MLNQILYTFSGRKFLLVLGASNCNQDTSRRNAFFTAHTVGLKRHTQKLKFSVNSNMFHGIGGHRGKFEKISALRTDLP